MSDEQLRGIDPIVPGLYFVALYWMAGPNIVGKGGPKSEVSTPPGLGWSTAFLLDRGVDERNRPTKLVTLFCPYTLEGHQVSRLSFEYTSIRHPAWRQNRPEGEPELYYWERVLPRLRERLQVRWAEAARYSWQSDFDTAAVIMRMLDMEVPHVVAKQGAELKILGGKSPDALGLLRPVKRSSRKGQVLAFFWPQTRSIREAMAEFSITRSNVLSQLFLLTKDNGIGYELKGDTAVVIMPPGCESPWDTEEKAK